jgi:N-acetylneuraminic acid mutarotase
MKNKIISLAFILSTLVGYSQDKWVQLANFPGLNRSNAVNFVIGSKVYVGTGYNGTTYCKDFYEYNPATNQWTKKADFPGDARDEAVAFAIGNKGYVGTGISSTSGKYKYYRDFWEYNSKTNQWSKIADLPAKSRYSAVAFSIGDKGYVGTGVDSLYVKLSDFWEYDTTANVWTKKKDYAGLQTYMASSFSIGSKGYIGLGHSGEDYKKDLWEYDPFTNNWTQKADFGGIARANAFEFSIGNFAYVGMGNNGFMPYYQKDVWEYDAINNQWKVLANYSSTARSSSFSFAIDSKGYMGGGFTGSYKNDFWGYTPPTKLAELEQVEAKMNISLINNPIHDRIILTNLSEMHTTELFNSYGQSVWKGKNIESTDFSFLENGLYFLLVSDAYESHSLKVLKK